jgi:glycerol uptake facilitator-like aquaporin
MEVSPSHHEGGFLSTIKYSLSKLIFELIGTTFLTLIFLSGQGNVKYGGNFYAQQTALLLGLWILTIFGYRISGSHYNPAISLAFMFRKDIGHFPRPLGLAYIVF